MINRMHIHWRRVTAVAAVAALALAAGLAPVTAQSCAQKTGRGTGSTADFALFQAWEEVLQTTDWGAWASWMALSQKVGEAPGYRATIKSRACQPRDGQHVCEIVAMLCKS